ncbi:SDR family NAD(P)-dependent oxidoreductase [Actinomadura montaniterrae]|uniref:SDR family oxidoreductase n=1 Tax=Actinomadura montaniterrae TaxID=1803903 RepID=A0A6L3VHI3_9ACTN|nr:SDR family oxidoreductase [Actinomadura montaniterrae]KAB2368877.1 SDR family oxidoreductase [Actinomadura montaniterrae]
MGRVLIVTGGGSGIGAAVAAAAAERGDTAVICGRRKDALERVAAATGAEPRVCDVSDPDAVADLVDGVVAAHGRLDGLVANAGVMRAGAVLDLTPEDWDVTLRTNLTSVFLLAKAALPHLIEAKGALVAVSSVAALRAPLDGAAYATSKAALTMLTQTIAADYGPRGVRANVVCPGWIRTEMADAEMSEFGAPLGLGREEAYAEVTRLVPQRRPGTPQEAAAAVLWLLGPEASYVNGAVLSVDGGTALPDPGTVPFAFEVRAR